MFRQLPHALQDKLRGVSEFVQAKHAGQLRDDGVTSYFEGHLLKVYKVCDYHYLCFSPEYVPEAHLDICMIALCHDLLEDTDTTYQELVDLIGEANARVVDELTITRLEMNIEFIEYKRTKQQMLLKRAFKYSQWAKFVKIADRSKNIQDMATGGWDKRRQKKYLENSLELLNTIRFDFDGADDWMSRLVLFNYKNWTELYLNLIKE
jgi:(p)ppGpp synthase/HD superfamily hydrolase